MSGILAEVREPDIRGVGGEWFRQKAQQVQRP